MTPDTTGGIPFNSPNDVQRPMHAGIESNYANSTPPRTNEETPGGQVAGVTKYLLVNGLTTAQAVEVILYFRPDMPENIALYLAVGFGALVNMIMVYVEALSKRQRK